MGSFTTNQVVGATDLQAIWYNMETLKDPEIALQRMEGGAGSFWTQSSTAFLPIDGTYYGIEVETYGGDLLLAATVSNNHSVANGRSAYQFSVDGVELGNTEGGMLFMRRFFTTPETNQVLYIAEGIAAGNHRVDLLTKNINATGDVRTYKVPCLTMYVMEFP